MQGHKVLRAPAAQRTQCLEAVLSCVGVAIAASSLTICPSDTPWALTPPPLSTHVLAAEPGGRAEVMKGPSAAPDG